MPTPVIPAPAVPVPAARRVAASDLPMARIPEQDGCAPLTIDLDELDGAAKLRVAGEIDLLTVEQLRAALDQALAGVRRSVVVDVRDVSFVDCAGIGLLLDARWCARRRGIALAIRPSRALVRIAALLDLSAALDLDPLVRDGDDRDRDERA